MHLIARFPNVINDFGEKVYLQTQRAGNESKVSVVAFVTYTTNKALMKRLDGKLFPGALVPASALDTTAADDLLVVDDVIGGKFTKHLCAGKEAIKKAFSVVFLQIAANRYDGRPLDPL